LQFGLQSGGGSPTPPPNRSTCGGSRYWPVCGGLRRVGAHLRASRNTKRRTCRACRSSARTGGPEQNACNRAPFCNGGHVALRGMPLRRHRSAPNVSNVCSCRDPAPIRERGLERLRSALASRAPGLRVRAFRTPRPRLAPHICTENVPPCRRLLAVKQAPEPRLVGGPTPRFEGGPK